MDSSNKSVINIQLKRAGLDIVMEIKVAKEIEDFFRKASLDNEYGDDDGNRENVYNGITKTSRKWLNANGEGLEYYVKNRKLSDKVGGYEIMDNFGNGLLEGEKFNLAFLRIVGVSKGVTIKTTDLLSLEEMKEYIQKLAEWTKRFYKEQLTESELIATINVDVKKEDEPLASIEA